MSIRIACHLSFIYITTWRLVRSRGPIDESINPKSSDVMILYRRAEIYRALEGEPQFFIIDTWSELRRDKVQDVPV